MCPRPSPRQDGTMNATDESPPPSGPDDRFDAQKLRSITDMRRSQDDRVVAGVCSGAARYLNVDPVVIRVLLAVLTLAGFAGAIIYIAAWLLLPSDGADKSLVAEWFKIDKNEEQVRVGGMIGAVVLALLSAVGDGSWSWWGEAPWWILPFALLAYVFWIRPRRRRESREAREDALRAELTQAFGVAGETQVITKPPRSTSSALLGLTSSIAMIALAATWIYEETNQDLPWTTYVAVALGVVGLGLLIGTFFGNGGGLIWIGILLAATLAVGSVVPEGGFGEERQSPTTASELDASYRHGVGLLEVDLTQVEDLTSLVGRTVELRNGIGKTQVFVPRDLPVNIESHLSAGEIRVFGRSVDGTDRDLDIPSTTQPALTITIDQRLGSIEVIRR